MADVDEIRIVVKDTPSEQSPTEKLGPSLPCPRCGRGTILVVHTVWMVPVELGTGHFHLCEPFGGVTREVPDVSEAFCNSASCDWRGTLRNVAEGTL